MGLLVLVAVHGPRCTLNPMRALGRVAAPANALPVVGVVRLVWVVFLVVDVIDRPSAGFPRRGRLVSKLTAAVSERAISSLFFPKVLAYI